MKNMSLNTHLYCCLLLCNFVFPHALFIVDSMQILIYYIDFIDNNKMVKL